MMYKDVAATAREDPKQEFPSRRLLHIPHKVMNPTKIATTTL
jgi:hypothetical protein